MFENGDRVRMLRTMEGFAAGCQGVVINIDSMGNLEVTLDRDERGNALASTLLPHGPANFEKL